MIIAGIDPGPEESAFVLWDGKSVLKCGNMANSLLLFSLFDEIYFPEEPSYVAIEQIRGFGVIAGDNLFDTCFWSGRFFERWGEKICRLVPRKKVVAHLCGTGARGGDRFVREALIARLGPPGTKKNQGPTWGIAGHCWAALGVAVTFADSIRDVQKESSGNE